MTHEEINKKLVENYGRDLYGNPNYRVVWSTSQTERRFGTFEDYFGDIYLRTVTEVREVPKYPLYPDFWVFEKATPNSGNPELKANISYEPLWIFKHPKTGEYLAPEWWACEAIVHADRAIKKLQMNQNDVNAMEELRMLNEKMRFKLMLQDESPYLAGAIHNGSAAPVQGFRDDKKDTNVTH